MSLPAAERPATEKQLAFIRSFGVEPQAHMTVSEASALLDKLTSDPEAYDRKHQLEMERRQKTPAPKGVGAKARRLLKDSNDAAAWFGELEGRLRKILRYASLEEDEGQGQAIKEEFDLRMDDIKDAVENCLDEVGMALEALENAADREEKREAAHDLADHVTEYEKPVNEAKADLVALIKWTDELLEQLSPEK